MNGTPASPGRVFCSNVIAPFSKKFLLRALEDHGFIAELPDKLLLEQIPPHDRDLLGWCAVLPFLVLAFCITLLAESLRNFNCPGQRDAPSHSRYRDGERIRLKICKDRHGPVTL